MKTAKRRPAPSKVPFRFLFWFDGEVRRVSLMDGESIYFREFHYHDEGWSSCDVRVSRVGGVVELDQYTDGRDCDGRMSSESHSFCRRDDLRAHVPYRYAGEKRDRNRYPRWTQGEYSQRDYSAEAMGY